MDCDATRDAISLEIDGRGEPTAAVAAHLAGCTACAAWREQARRLAQAHVAAATPAPRPPTIESLRPAGFRRSRWLRIGLAWAGILLLVWNVAGIISGGDDGAAVHLFRHQSAFSAALGITFLFVAWRPDRAYGLVPFAAAFTLALSATALIDLVGGSSDSRREARHLVEIAGLVVLWILGVAAGPGRPRASPQTGEPRLGLAPDPNE